MAVYGKYREPWNPKKRKTKVSKNNTYERKFTTVSNVKVFDLKNTLWTHLRMGDTIDWEGAKRQTQSSNADSHLIGFEPVAYTKLPSSWTPTKMKIDKTRFGFALDFEKRAASASQAAHNYIRENQYSEWTPSQLFGGPNNGTHDQRGPRNIFISFWIKTYVQNADNDGHTFAHWGLGGSTANEQPFSIDPRIGFHVSSSGAVSIRFMEHFDGTDTLTGGHPAPGEEYVFADGSPAFVQTSSPAGKITVGNWHHVTFALKFTNGWDATQATVNTKVYIDGVECTPEHVSRSPASFSIISNEDETDWEWQFGSLMNGLGSYDSGSHNVRRSSGFSGALGEFLVITQECADNEEIKSFAKFLYEGTREGVYALHSGIHSSSPRLELRDLDKDSLYPSSFAMSNLTKYDSAPYFSKQSEASWKESSRYQLSSQSRYEEGYNPSETWKEKASKYYIQSSTILPHLKLNPSDTLLTNGNWYSDARSEFFEEDLDPSTGFVVKSTANHVPKSSDELYKEHASNDYIAPFVEDHIPQEYKDCIIIEIPIPSTAACTLSTDGDGDSERRFLGSSFQTSNQSINTMAYYNFNTKRWEHTVSSYSTDGDGSGSKPGRFNWVNKGDIGFGPLTGLILPYSQRDVEYMVDQYGRPISDFGFPFANKFASSSGQSIDMSQYLDEPVVLEGWEIRQRVVPVVGYQHDGNTANGPEDYYTQSNVFNNSVDTSERKKVVFFPSGTITAGSNVTVTGIPFANYPNNGVGYEHELIDVYLNGELQRGGTQAQRTSGVADYNFGTDSGGNGRLQFRYNVGTSSRITVVAHDLGGGIRTKKFFSPGGTITAGTGVAVTGMSFATFNTSHDQIDVFLNGELLRGGEPSEVSGGTKDYSIADVSGVGNITFRFNVTTSDVIAVTGVTLVVADEGGESSGSRNKQTINVSSNVNAGSAFLVPNLKFGDYGYDHAKIDVYLGGELQKQGSVTEVTNGTADYRFITDSGTSGKIIFRYNLTTSDTVIAIGRQIGAIRPENPGEEGTGRNPFFYGGHGHATVMWAPHVNASPFTEANYADSQAGNWNHNNTVPIQADTLGASTPSIITKGVTAFLLKENSLVDTNIRKPNFFQEDRFIGLGTNLNNAYAWRAPNAGNVNTYGTSVALSNANVTLDYEADSFFNTSTTRTLVGYLQHIYHNDTNPTGSRSARDWVRYAYDSGSIGTIPKYRNQMNLVGILDRENETYISDILRVNTTEYDFHVSGSVKLQPKMKGSFPITNFKVDEVYQVQHEDQPHLNNSYYAESIFPSNEGGVDNPLINSEFIPAVPSLPELRSLEYPAHPLPASTTSATTTEKNNWKTNFITSIVGSKNQVEAAETILRPDDKLILGIQDSVSTCFASQQNRPDLTNSTDGDTDFIRWGRNKLTIPVQQDSYIRLYVKRTRGGQTFNVPNTSYNFNQNVNRDIGDQFCDDDHLLNVPLMFTGSLADDVMGPSTFTDPIIAQSVSYDSTLNNQPVYDHAAGAGAISALLAHFLVQSSSGNNGLNNYFGAQYTPHGYSSRPVQTSDFTMPWGSFSQRVFDNTTSNYPAIPMLAALDAAQNATMYMESSIIACLQSVIMHPQNVIGAADPLNNASYWWTTPSYTKGYTRYGMGLTSVIEELDDRDPAHQYAGSFWSSYQYVNNAGATITKNWNGNQIVNPGNAGSAWYTKINTPIITKGSSLEPQFDTLEVEFRFVRIGAVTSGTDFTVYSQFTSPTTGAGGWQNKYPVYPELESGDPLVEMDIGDAFYIDEDGKARKLLTFAEIQSFNSTTVHAKQKWARNWQVKKQARGGQVVYIVAVKGSMKTPGLTTRPLFMTQNGMTVYTYNQLYAKIADVMKAQAHIDEGLLYTDVLANTGSEFLKVVYPNDPTIRFVLKNYKSSIDTANIFTLSGKDVVKDGNPPEFFYLKKKAGDTSSWWTNLAGIGTTNLAQWQSGTDTSGNPVYTLTPGGGEFLKGYLRTQTLGSRGAITGTLATIADYPSGTTERNYNISYAGIPSDNVTIELVEETFTKEAPHIDRKVSFRTTQNNAGPFGSLNQFKKLESNNVIYDSLIPDLAQFKTSSIDLAVAGFTQNWLLEETSEKLGESNALELIKVRVKTGGSERGFLDSQYTQDGQPIVLTSLDFEKKGSGGVGDEWTTAANNYGVSNTSDSSSDWPTIFTNGAFPVTNYIQNEFSGLSDYSRKTGRDLILGFGNNFAGRHMIRPLVYKYKAFSMGTDYSEPRPVVVDMQLDKPRGARFGLYNTQPSKTGYIFSYRSYGNFRDMLEQGLDTRFDNDGDNQEVFGPAVVINAVSPINPDSPKEIADTRRYNKDINAKITKPFIDKDGTSTPNPTPLNDEQLRVDVAGRIRTRTLVAPGNISANIFRRS